MVMPEEHKSEFLNMRIATLHHDEFDMKIGGGNGVFI